jgi:hypothetical protein
MWVTHIYEYPLYHIHTFRYNFPPEIYVDYLEILVLF